MPIKWLPILINVFPPIRRFVSARFSTPPWRNNRGYATYYNENIKKKSLRITIVWDIPHHTFRDGDSIWCNSSTISCYFRKSTLLSSVWSLFIPIPFEAQISLSTHCHATTPICGSTGQWQTECIKRPDFYYFYITDQMMHLCCKVACFMQHDTTVLFFIYLDRPAYKS